MLADVFEKFRICWKIMDSVQISIWGHQTKIKLERMSDADIYLVFSLWDMKDMKRGVSYITKRYSKIKYKYYISISITNISMNFMNQNKNQNISYTYMRIMYIFMQCLSYFQHVDSNR